MSIHQEAPPDARRGWSPGMFGEPLPVVRGSDQPTAGSTSGCLLTPAVSKD